MNNSILSSLKQLALSFNEARVYTVLAELGQTSAGSIIKKTQFHRSVVYTSLDKLISKKLVFQVTRKKIAHYQITDPHILLERVRDQEKIARELVPAIKKLGINKLPEINIYEGVESYRKYWIDTVRKLPKGSVSYIAGSISQKWISNMGNKAEKFTKVRIERNFKWKMIVFEKNQIEIGLAKKYPKLHEYRLIKRNVDFEGNYNIINNDILLLHSATEPLIIEIRNQTLVNVFKNIFDILWESGKKI